MANGPLLRSLAAMLLSIVLLSATACDDGGLADSASSKEDQAVQPDLSGEDPCDVAGDPELTAFLAENDIELYNEDRDGQAPNIQCSFGVVWSATEANDDYRTNVRFGLRIFDSIAEAEKAIDIPGRIQLTSPESRKPEGGLDEHAPGPWEEGFIWSTPDSYELGQTEAAARMANLVLWMDFESYTVYGPEQCDRERELCGVMPSDLVTWLHDEYLPAVGANVKELIDG
jgi:hypothetical protein